MQAATLLHFRTELILATFSDQAVTALGLYYKWQTFFFILWARCNLHCAGDQLQLCCPENTRCKQTLITSVLFRMALMALGTFALKRSPPLCCGCSTSDARCGNRTVGFRFIGVAFSPGYSLIFPVFFQAVGSS